MSVNNGLFTSNSGEWETPQDLFDRLDAEFHFHLDAAASAENAKCAKFLTKEQDALKIAWCLYGKSIWLNPPYGREIAAFIRKAYQEAQRGCTVVCLLPARTDTAYWHDYVMHAAEIRLIRGRLRFGGATNSAPFPSCIVVFRGHCQPVVSSWDIRKERA